MTSLPLVADAPVTDLEVVSAAFGCVGQPASLREVAAQVATRPLDEVLNVLKARSGAGAVIHGLIASRRTIDHRRQFNQSLTRDEAERAVTFVHIVVIAERIFGDRQRAMRWLELPNDNLDTARPIELLRTALGARDVEEELVRIEEGYFG